MKLAVSGMPESEIRPAITALPKIMSHRYDMVGPLMSL
jgi:hypothetical protein